MSASGTRDSLRHALGAALERAERAEAAAEEARQAAVGWEAIADKYKHANADNDRTINALRTSLEETRQDYDAAVYGHGQCERLSQARIGELEAALREIGTWESRHLDVPEPGYGAQIALEMRSIARRALQLTTERR